jgi:hypothetical protein
MQTPITSVIGRSGARPRGRREWIAVLVFLLMLSQSAFAHDIGVSAGIARITSQALFIRLDFSLDEVNAAIGASLDQPDGSQEERQETLRKLGDFIAHAVEIRFDGRVVSAAAATYHVDEDDRVVYIAYRFQIPPNSRRLEARTPVMDRLAPNHHQYWEIFNERSEKCTDAEVTTSRGVVQVSFAELLAQCAAAHSQEVVAAQRARAMTFVEAGATHLFTGYDHLIVLLALLLGSSTRFARIATLLIYTAAHSAGLALTGSGVMQIPAAVASTLTAIAVIYMAVRAFVGKPAPCASALGLAIGLIHGMTICTATGEMSALPIAFAKAEYVLCFTLGMLAAEAAVTVASLPLLWRLERIPQVSARYVPAISLLVAVVGTYWLLSNI